VKDVHWIQPTIVRGVILWPDPCAAKITTPESIGWRNRAKIPNDCGCRAKVSFRGIPLCVRHARVAALEELAGKEPGSQDNSGVG